MPAWDAQGNYIDPATGEVLVRNPLLGALSGRYGEAAPEPEMTMEPEYVGEGSDERPMEFPPQQVIPGMRVTKLPTRIEEVGQEGVIPAAAEEAESADAFGRLLSLPGRFAEGFQESARTQAEAKAKAKREAPYAPESTFGSRVGLEREKLGFQQDQNQALSTERAAYERQARVRQAALDGFRDQELTRLRTEFEAWKKTDVDPAKAFGDKNFVQKAMGVLGALFGSQAVFTNGGRNPALEIINRMVEQSIEAQKANLAAKGQQFDASMSLYGLNLQNRLDEEQAWHQTRSMMFDSLAREWALKYDNRFADRELMQNYRESYEQLMAESAKSAEESGRLAEKHIYEMAETEAKIRETLTQAGLNEANIRKILGDLKGGAGGGAMSPQAEGTTFGNESEIMKHFGFDKPGETPPFLGDPFKSSGGGIMTEVVVAGAPEGAESVFGSLRGKALLEDKDAVRALREDARSWAQLYRVYLSLERTMLDRKVPWDEAAVRNKQLAAQAGLEELSHIKGAASEADWALVKDAMGQALDPNKIRDLKDPETRRRVFTTMRQTIDARIDAALGTYAHARTGADGQLYEFRLRWRPPTAGVVPGETADEDAELGRGDLFKGAESGSADLAKRSATQVFDEGGRALKSDDYGTVENALANVDRMLGALRKGKSRATEGEGTKALFGPTKTGETLEAQRTSSTREALSREMKKKTTTDERRRKIKEELVDLERREKRQTDTGRSGWRATFSKSEGELKAMQKRLKDKLDAIRKSREPKPVTPMNRLPGLY